MPLYRFRINIRVAAPVLTTSSIPDELGVDSPCARTSSGQLYIPGTLIEGHLRESWNELQFLGIVSSRVDRWRGSPSHNGDEPQRGCLTIQDLVLVDVEPGWSNGSSGNYRERTQIDQELGSVRHGALQTMESPLAVGQSAAFSGCAVVFAADIEDARGAVQDVDWGLRWASHIGSNRTIGFGRICAVHLTQPKDLADESEATDLVGATRFGIQVRPRSPFCFAKRPVSRNYFESELYIPAAAIKGALVSTLKGSYAGSAGSTVTESEVEEIIDHLGVTRFTHGLPSSIDIARRPVVPPRSLVFCTAESTDHEGDGPCKEVYDVALMQGPGLIHGRAPAFEPDWKSNQHQRVNAQFGWPENLRKETRVRTAIDSAVRRHASEQLFAYESVIPDDHCWNAIVDLSAVEQSARSRLSVNLQRHMIRGLAFLGKTKAEADVRVLPLGSIEPDAKSYLQPIHDDTGKSVYVLTLQSACLLGDPRRQSQHPQWSRLWLQEAYNADFDQMSHGLLTLLRCFADQSFAGGHYLWRRYGRSDHDYYPYLLTLPGSVFVLEVVGDPSKAQSLIQSWHQCGLPLPAWALKQYGGSWSENPYIPENGYGEIAVNLGCHTELKPTTSDFEAIDDISTPE